MINPFPFKVLFWFENDEKIITEIKRTDIQSEDKGLIYKWLLIQNENEKQNEDKISVLTFQSMVSSEESQTRTFAEGRLEWDAKQVLFNAEELKRIKPDQVTEKWMRLVADFLD
ncbi:hypothetical protein [Fluviicola sp.]|uniref:hypothetical protein n=1 Tax=Fluviicola sp. TaxID=1917219 RepID=UPI0031D27B86